MIVVNDSTILQADFLKLLEIVKIYTIEALIAQGENAKRMGGDAFETIVFNNCLTASKGTPFEGHVIQTGAHAFPDIIARKFFGVEVKMTTADKWVSTGNSILETTRINEVERIYLFFGKLGGNVDIRYRAYQDCLYDIGVTHSPRYKIDMELSDGKSIFAKMGISYEDLRQDKHPIKRIKNYYRRQLQDGEELWWMDNQVEEKTVSPIIKPFRILSRQAQENYFVESMILFPEIFGKTQTKYERPAAYLITRYNCVSSNLRDIFSAGGQEKLTLHGKQVTVPKIFVHLFAKAKDIAVKITDIEEDDLKYYWKLFSLEGSRIELWKGMINKQASFQLDNISAAEIYEAGL